MRGRPGLTPVRVGCNVGVRARSAWCFTMRCGLWSTSCLRERAQLRCSAPSLRLSLGSALGLHSTLRVRTLWHRLKRLHFGSSDTFTQSGLTQPCSSHLRPLTRCLGGRLACGGSDNLERIGHILPEPRPLGDVGLSSSEAVGFFHRGWAPSPCWATALTGVSPK